MGGGPYSAGLAAARLTDGRLHLHHGPIDLVVEAFGPRPEIEEAYGRARSAFAGMLEGLVAELPALRRPLGDQPAPFRGAVARRMADAVTPYGDRFITPMAAVAGAVADEVLAALTSGGSLIRAYVNNGGDIAFHLAPGAALTLGVVADVARPAIAGTLTLRGEMAARGIATSGWGGRSDSLGIADAVTVLARSAAEADAAATLIANAVDTDHPAIERAPASTLSDDTDLGDRLVTVAVGILPRHAAARALEAGEALAHRFRAAGRIEAALLFLGGELRVVGDPRMIPADGAQPPDVAAAPLGTG